MPVKRRKAKARALQITSEALAAFKTATALEPIYRGCDREAGRCQSDSVGAHCGDCERYLDATRELSHQLKLPPWSMCPADSGLDGAMPDYMANNPSLCIRETWEPVKEIRLELKKLAARSV